MGHLEFVSAITEVSHSLNALKLVSISGDKTLRLWDCFNGQELFRAELPAPGLHLIKRKNQLAVSMLNERPIIGIYNITSSEDKFQITKFIEYQLSEHVKHINSMIFESDDCIWLSCYGENNVLVLKQLHLIGDDVTETDLHEQLKFVPSIKLPALDDITILFKKKFDNTKHYQEKKKRRLGYKKNQ